MPVKPPDSLRLAGSGFNPWQRCCQSVVITSADEEKRLRDLPLVMLPFVDIKKGWHEASLWGQDKSRRMLIRQDDLVYHVNHAVAGDDIGRSDSRVVNHHTGCGVD